MITRPRSTELLVMTSTTPVASQSKLGFGNPTQTFMVRCIGVARSLLPTKVFPLVNGTSQVIFPGAWVYPGPPGHPVVSIRKRLWYDERVSRLTLLFKSLTVLINEIFYFLFTLSNLRCCHGPFFHDILHKPLCFKL